MAENTELQLVQQQANNITRQIATLKSDTENAVQANRKSYEACVQAGESLLSDISASGMNDALDEKAAEFIKKAKLTEYRRPGIRYPKPLGQPHARNLSDQSQIHTGKQHRKVHYPGLPGSEFGTPPPWHGILFRYLSLLLK